MEEIIRFLTEYTERFEAMEQKQVEKLGLLMTKELDKVEQTILIQQALDKEIESMERKRLKLFAEKGLAGKTLREIAGSCPETQEKELLGLYRRLDGAIGNIRYYNQKAEELARTQLGQMGIDSRYMGNPAGIYGRPAPQRGSRLERKV